MLSVVVPDSEAEVGLPVRPDALWIPVGARVENVAPPRAVAAIRAAAEAVHARLVPLHAGAQLLPGRLDLGGSAGDKSSRAEEGDVQLNGVVTLPLDAGADFWARAALSARAVEALREAARALSKGKPQVLLGWRAPVGRITDVEPHRAALTARWNTHVRALTEGGAAGAPAGWDAPSEVAQIPVSLEEARLVLVPCRPPARR